MHTHAQEAMRLLWPAAGELLAQQTAAQQTFATHRRNEGGVQPTDYLHLERTAQEDLTKPRMLLFRWEDAEGRAGPPAAWLEIAEEPSFASTMRFVVALPGQAIVHSLKPACTLFWRVTDAEGHALSATGSFRTADETPRWIFIEGVSNVRDLGNFPTIHGKRTRLGVLFRGGEFNSHMTVTTEGRRFLLECLKLRSILDLRRDTERGRLPLDGDAFPGLLRRFTIPCLAYADILLEEQMRYYAEAFRVVANPDNLPCYFHCWGGADRTGTLALLLCAVLGVHEELLLLDYEATSLSIWGERSRSSDFFTAFRQALESIAPNRSLHEQAVQYFLHIGIRPAELEAFRTLLL